jgi:hypothetical protein
MLATKNHNWKQPEMRDLAPNLADYALDPNQARQPRHALTMLTHLVFFLH